MGEQGNKDAYRKRRKLTVLPNGQIPFANIADMQTREAVMKIGENIVSVAKRVAELESRIRTIEGGA